MIGSCWYHNGRATGMSGRSLLRLSSKIQMVIPPQCLYKANGGVIGQPKRFFSWTAHEEQEMTRHRHPGIQMHPDSISNLILPGNFVRRTTRRGKVQNQYTELEYGYFWMIKDLKQCNEKPILANESLIPDRDKKLFPILTNCKSLTGEKANFPDYLTRRNRSGDAAAHCTLVAISFRDFGFQQLPSWIEPFRQSFGTSDRAEVIKINFSDGWLNKWLLRGFIQGLTVRNTPIPDRASTFLYFGDDERFRDSLRMHNLMSGFVFLLDGLGYVRFAGSGEASTHEAERLVRLAQNLTPLLHPAPFLSPQNKSAPMAKKKWAR